MRENTFDLTHWSVALLKHGANICSKACFRYGQRNPAAATLKVENEKLRSATRIWSSMTPAERGEKPDLLNCRRVVGLLPVQKQLVEHKLSRTFNPKPNRVM